MFEQMRDLNIDFDQVKNQLDDLTGNIQDLINDDGFWNNLRAAVKDFFRSLSNFISSLF